MDQPLSALCLKLWCLKCNLCIERYDGWMLRLLIGRIHTSGNSQILQDSMLNLVVYDADAAVNSTKNVLELNPSPWGPLSRIELRELLIHIFCKHWMVIASIYVCIISLNDVSVYGEFICTIIFGVAGYVIF